MDVESALRHFFALYCKKKTNIYILKHLSKQNADESVLKKKYAHIIALDSIMLIGLYYYGIHDIFNLYAVRPYGLLALNTKRSCTI